MREGPEGLQAVAVAVAVGFWLMEWDVVVCLLRLSFIAFVLFSLFLFFSISAVFFFFFFFHFSVLSSHFFFL